MLCRESDRDGDARQLSWRNTSCRAMEFEGISTYTDSEAFDYTSTLEDAVVSDDDDPCVIDLLCNYNGHISVWCGGCIVADNYSSVSCDGHIAGSCCRVVF